MRDAAILLTALFTIGAGPVLMHSSSLRRGQTTVDVHRPENIGQELAVQRHLMDGEEVIA